MNKRLAGRRIRLLYSPDPYTTLKPGDEGTIDFTDDLGTVHVTWDKGNSLGLIPGQDSWAFVPSEPRPSYVPRIFWSWVETLFAQSPESRATCQEALDKTVQGFSRLKDLHRAPAPSKPLVGHNQAILFLQYAFIDRKYIVQGITPDGWCFFGDTCITSQVAKWSTEPYSLCIGEWFPTEIPGLMHVQNFDRRPAPTPHLTLEDILR